MIQDKLITIDKAVDDTLSLIKDYQSGKIKPLFPASNQIRKLIYNIYIFA